jgi:iron complex transport system substrate-binding protein
LRVVSLLPSATEIVHFVGAKDTLVGVTHECDYPSGVENLPRLTSTAIDHHMLTSAQIDAAIGERLTEAGSIYSLDTRLLEELEPDLILTQGLCEVCAVSLSLVEQAAASLQRAPRILSMNPTSLSEVLDATIEVGDATGHGAKARAKVAALRKRLAQVEAVAVGLTRPRVGCLEWLDPPFSAGHWVPEMVHLAGGRELFVEAREPSRYLSWRAVLEAAPEVLVLMPCGLDVGRTLREARVLPVLPGWEDLLAVKNSRVWAVDANSYFSRPAPRLVEGVEILAHILHPEVFPAEPAFVGAKHFSHAFI